MHHDDEPVYAYTSPHTTSLKTCIFQFSVTIPQQKNIGLYFVLFKTKCIVLLVLRPRITSFLTVSKDSDVTIL